MITPKNPKFTVVDFPVATLSNPSPTDAVYSSSFERGTNPSISWGEPFQGLPTSSIQFISFKQDGLISAGTVSPTRPYDAFTVGFVGFSNGITILGTEINRLDFRLDVQLDLGGGLTDSVSTQGQFLITTTPNIPDDKVKSADFIRLDFPLATTGFSNTFIVGGKFFYAYEGQAVGGLPSAQDASGTLLAGLILDKNSPILTLVGFGEVTSGEGFITDERGTVLSSSVPELAVGDFVNPGDAPIITEGTNKAEELTGTPGDDILRGFEGKDTLIGLSGNDILSGGNGSDTLIGTDPNTNPSGVGELDTLTGENGKDVFVLGNSNSVFYNDGNSNTIGDTDLAIISDFENEDYIQLKGISEDYILDSTFTINGNTGTGIFLEGSVNELIGFVENVTNLSLDSSNDFVYV